MIIILQPYFIKNFYPRVAVKFFIFCYLNKTKQKNKQKLYVFYDSVIPEKDFLEI